MRTGLVSVARTRIAGVLRELHINGLGVIEDLDLQLHPGLNVLSGETGAGKTMVTVGLSLALGARASATLVRQGSRAAQVQARFEVGETPESPLAEWVEDGELILARSITADGKGSARISGQLATASALAELGGALVEVHGQHPAQRLLSPATQTAFLDRFAGDEHMVALATYRETFDELRAATAALEELQEAGRDRERELDLLAYQVREIEALSPQAGESAALVAEEARLSHIERLMELAAMAEGVFGSDDGVTDAVGTASVSLTETASLDPDAAELAARSNALSADLIELARDVRRYREGLLPDPGRLQEVRERFGALRGLQRKYGETDADVLAFLSQASARIAQMTGAGESIAELQSQVSALEERITVQDSRVTSGRTQAAPALAGALVLEIRELGMPGASLDVALDPLPDMGQSGSERVELRFSAGPGQTAAPLMKAASGGELSRTMLACRSVLADLDDVPTIVFDEVDAGIGGQAGLAVGRRLARLASERQILVVTHLPQIACFADRHIRVTKDRGTASVQVLDDDERVRELSRMLAGLDSSQSALTHAQELLDEAARVRTA
jgi:DNA repair protein RecN (Recombination protein N)